mgnify:CR=1 FL=1
MYLYYSLPKQVSKRGMMSDLLKMKFVSVGKLKTSDENHAEEDCLVKLWHIIRLTMMNLLKY